MSARVVWDWVRRIAPRTIIECGAHRGEDTMWMSEAVGPTGAVHAIEADPRNLPPADLLARGNVSWTAAAVSDREGEADFVLSQSAPDREGAWTESSSLRAPLEHLTLYPGVTFGGTARVRTITIDGYCRDKKIERVDLLWADVQGAEDLLLDGAQETLKNLSWLALEMSEQEVYAGQKRRSEIAGWLGQRGWRLAAFDAEGTTSPMVLWANEQREPMWRQMLHLGPPPISKREDLGEVLNALGLVEVGAEIGCAYGAYAQMVLSKWRGMHYLMVDLWAPQSAEVYRETPSLDYDGCYRECAALAARDPRVRLIRADSVAAAAQIANGSLDFVFIDANHAYGPVLADMDAWFPKLRPGGIFAGHDFYNATEGGHYCEVQSAVERWMREHELPFQVTPCSSWWSRRPLLWGAFK